MLPPKPVPATAERNASPSPRKFDEGFATGKPREETIYFDTDPSWQLELAEFVDCIQTNNWPAHGTSDDAIKVMDLVYRIYEDDAEHAKALKKRWRTWINYLETVKGEET